MREQTTSSSSDSIFTDPLTPVGFAAEINQCYYSEENVCDETDTNLEHLSELAKAAIAARNYSRTSQSTQTKIGKLTLSSIDKFNIVDWKQRDESVILSSSWSPTADTMPLPSLRNKISPLIVGTGANDTNNVPPATPTSVFNVARVKKIELQDLSLLKGLDDGKCDKKVFIFFFLCVLKDKKKYLFLSCVNIYLSRLIK